MNLNKVMLIGRLTADPQLRTTSSGSPVASFSVATNRVWTNKAGEKQEDAEFHNIVIWGRQAEIVNQFLKKGALVMIEGRLQTRTWEGKDGQSRKTTEIIGERVQFGPRSSSVQASASSSASPSSEQQKKPKPAQQEETVPEIALDAEGEEIKGKDISF